IRTLHAVEMTIGAEICAVNQFAVGIEVQSPGVAATLAEKLELMRQRMVAPDALLKLDSTNMRRDRAALAAVAPAVRAPRQRVGNRMGVLHPKAAEAHDGVAVRDIVLIAIRVE